MLSRACNAADSYRTIVCVGMKERDVTKLSAFIAGVGSVAAIFALPSFGDMRLPRLRHKTTVSAWRADWRRVGAAMWCGMGKAQEEIASHGEQEQA